MKHILLFLCTLLFALTGNTAPACNESEQLLAEARTATNAAGSVSSGELERAMAEARRTMEATGREIERAVAEARRATELSDREIARAAAEARQAIDAAERIDLANQSLEELNKAAREQIVRELGLSTRQRREFEPIYKAYREALDKAVDARAGASGADEATQKNSLKAKLSNIAATAQVKRDYVDKFAAVLTAEQIRRLYNTEGEIGTNIKRAAFDRSSRTRSGRLKGSGRMVTQDWGKAGDYTGISAAAFFDITVSPAAKTISVTADDNVIDYLVLERDGGKLKFRVNANSTENISVSVTVPASASLREISAGSYGKVNCKMPLKGPSVSVSVSSYGSVSADIDTPGAAKLDVSSYGKFAGSVRCSDGELRISSYGSAQAPVECRNSCKLTVGCYAKFSNDIKASDLTVEISSGASVGSTLTADALDEKYLALNQILRHGDGKRPAGEADRQQRRLVQRDIQRQFARSERRKLRQNLPERRGAGRRRHGPGFVGREFLGPRTAGLGLRPDGVELRQSRRLVFGPSENQRFDGRQSDVRRSLHGRNRLRQHPAQKVNANNHKRIYGNGPLFGERPVVFPRFRLESGLRKRFPATNRRPCDKFRKVIIRKRSRPKAAGLSPDALPRRRICNENPARTHSGTGGAANETCAE